MSHPQDFYSPHDYYGPDGFPEHRVMGHPRDYLEPDILGTEAGDSLPIASTVGAGPPGRGIMAREWSDSELGAWGFEILDDESGEVLFRSPNLIPGRIIVTQDKHNLMAGEQSVAHVHYLNEGFEKVEDIVLNPGADGTRIYFRQDILENFTFDNTHAHTINFEDLHKHEFHNDQHHLHPEPRVDDVIVGFAQGNGRFYLTIGIIEFSNLDHDDNYPYDILYVIHTAYEWFIPHVGENGNWWYNDQDLGFAAQGPKGERGEKGYSTVVEIKHGEWYLDGQPTGWKCMGPQGEPGHTPDIGLNGNWWVNGKDLGKPATGPQGPEGPAGPMPELSVDPETGNWLVNGEDTGYPSRGEDGFAFDLQYNYYDLYEDELPDYDSAPFGFAFVVHDTDPELPHDRYDLYYKGRVPVAAEDGGPWVVVEDWQGRDGTGVHAMRHPYALNETIGETVDVSMDEREAAFAPDTRLGEGDVIIDENGRIGVVTESNPETRTYTIETVGKLMLDIPTFHLLKPPYHFNTEIGSQTLFTEDLETLSEPPENLKLHSLYLDENGVLAELVKDDEAGSLFETKMKLQLDIDRITEAQIDELLQRFYHRFDVGPITDKEIDDMMDGDSGWPSPHLGLGSLTNPEIDELFEDDDFPEWPNGDDSDLHVGSLSFADIDDAMK